MKDIACDMLEKERDALLCAYEERSKNEMETFNTVVDSTNELAILASSLSCLIDDIKYGALAINDALNEVFSVDERNLIKEQYSAIWKSKSNHNFNGVKGKEDNIKAMNQNVGFSSECHSPSSSTFSAKKFGDDD